MAALFAYRCRCCGELHEGSPNIGFDAPHPYELLDAEERTRLATLGSDLCTIDYGDHCDHFVRACLEVPIRGYAEPFTWGAWASLSAASFACYRATWEQPNPDESWFGWFSNCLPGYPDTLNLKCRVCPRGDDLRPQLVLEPTGHPLALDYDQGMTPDQAQVLAERITHGNGGER